MKAARWLGWSGVLVLVACGGRTASDPCFTSADCAEGQACLVDAATEEGVCLDAPGRDDPPPPLRVFATPPVIDVLLVVDDGPTTAELQARLVASLGALLDAPSDLRVAVTNTTNDELCDAPAELSNGALVGTSCLDRLDRFVAPDGTDARWLCTDACSYTTAELGLDPERPWLDVHALPEGIDRLEALACLVPQGIAGCEHAAPLRALAGAQGREDWHRHWLTQAVVVTDGVDCSVSDEGVAAFDPAGSRALWSDPTADEPTSAVCWNAGVSCEGDPAGFDECWPADIGLDGAPVPDDGEPVLISYGDVTRYFSSADLELRVIAGVPVGDPDEPTYSAVGDPAWLLEHGIDPGCSDGTITALPPVRLRGLTSMLSSACSPDYSEPLRDLGYTDPFCLRPCEAAEVTVTFEPPGQEPIEIPGCEGQYPGFTVPAGAPACFAMQGDTEACAPYGNERTTELVFRVADPTETGAFLLDPNPWSAEVELAGCGG
ncbi:hypothetical protein [Paraliomyxa miuraensis]|uniref:hypothetical protein n=1 Tax=Paraliomyxa miuraensis TaxID=376150 RepID=UPI00224F82E0|nr:hypothetical protein [Paraliomyxa miuraensis]MCX4244295.1 hypothetical protein [Paraliomyxa miuraensis]